MRASGPFASVVAGVLPRGYIAESFDAAVAGARATGERVATLDGDLVHGGHLVVGGGRRDARGILATKGEIKELRARIETERGARDRRLGAELAAANALVTETSEAIEARGAELHEIEKAIVSFEAQVSRSRDETVGSSARATCLRRSAARPSRRSTC